ncbi:hypothetical protein U14_04745 [Candidatus Moduliflexus flocculans]|uniref:Uncharacterized protein n=1 Tax=Candidatus Moduliflexus flocculans TaxID=1499966 RepID=A0A0S6W127_9BACT|nr:hypothetical protein U14_04745 [Candidatus Moduliflexus flocculans]
MVKCEQDQCKHLVPMKDIFDGNEFIIGYKCEEGFTIETNDTVGYARMASECEKYEKREE